MQLQASKMFHQWGEVSSNFFSFLLILFKGPSMSLPKQSEPSNLLIRFTGTFYC